MKTATRSPARARAASKGEQTREAILVHALGLATRIGFEGLTIGRLAEDLRMSKSGHPSTTVKLIIGYYPWGPMLSLAITGHQTEDWEFFPEECEMPIAMDVDGSVVAIYEEGRSFSPRELATYLTQAFRRCFPGVCLCP